MKILSLLCMLWIVTSHAASAQSLDIGGIELHIGQKIDDALKSLSAYNVKFQSNWWIVTQEVGGRSELLGSVGADKNVINRINKFFSLSHPSDAPEVYTRARKELRRRGGDRSFTREDIRTHTITFITQCGPYELAYNMPWELEKGVVVYGEVCLSVYK